MPDHAVRPLDLKLGDVARAVHRTMMAAYKVEATLLRVDDFPPLRRTLAQLSSAEATFLGVFTAGQSLAAVVEIEVPATQPTHICSLVVLPLYFRRGLATALVRHVVADHGDRGVTVSTGARNRPALELFTGLGFVEQRRWTRDGRIDMVTLARAPVPAGAFTP